MTNVVRFLLIVVAVVSASHFAGYGPNWLNALLGVRGERAAASGPSGSRLPVLQMSAEATEGLAQITPSRVVFFSTSWCPHCATVRNLLRKQGVRFTELDVERDGRAAAFQREKMPVVGFPVTVIGSQIVMGSDEGAILAALKSL